MNNVQILKHLQHQRIYFFPRYHTTYEVVPDLAIDVELEIVGGIQLQTKGIYNYLLKVGVLICVSQL